MSIHRGPLAASAVALVAAVAVGVVVGLRSDPGPARSVAPAAGATAQDAPTGSAPQRGRDRSGTSTAGVERMPETPGAPASRLPGLRPSPSAEFPAGLLVPVPQGRVLSRSASPSGDRMQAALVVQVPPRSGAAVLRFYRTHLAAAGYVEQPVRAVGGAQAASFARGRSGVVVTVRGATYSIFATLRTAQD